MYEIAAMSTPPTVPVPTNMLLRQRTSFVILSFIIVCCWVAMAIMLTSVLPLRQTIRADDDQALAQDWLFQSQYADLEFHDGEAARWLLNQPKKSYALVNRAIDDSLPRLATTFATHTAANNYGSYALRLATPIDKPITLTGATRTVPFNLSPGTRTYTLLVESAFVPVQTRLLPVSTTAFEGYGFSTTRYTQSSSDTRELIVDFRSATYTSWAGTPIRWWMWILMSLPLLVLTLYARSATLWYDPPLSLALLLLPWAMSALTGGTPTIEPIVTVLVCGLLLLSRRLADVLGIVMTQRATPLWVMVVLASCFTETRALAVSHWMLGVDFTAIARWSAFGAYLASMRAAFPIPLLSIEFFLTRTSIPFLFDVLYATVFVRFCAIAGILAALSIIPKSTYWWRWSTYLLGVVLCLGVAFVYRYDDRNYWMAYDACIGLAVVVVFLLFRTSLDRPIQWLTLGVAIVAADSLRPYMQLLLPFLIGAGLVRIWRNAGWRGLRWFLVPLSMSLVWHLYHIVQLGQWSWSNYAGFNIARAWVPDAYARAVVGLPPDMNHPEWGLRSAALIRTTSAWVVAHPVEAFRHGLSLLAEMLRFPVTIRRFTNDGGMYEVARVIPWYIGMYQLTAGIALVIQIVTLLFVVTRRPVQWAQHTFERVIWITVICMTAVSETGEQARFIASYIPLLCLGVLDIWTIPDWDTQRAHIRSRIWAAFKKK